MIRTHVRGPAEKMVLVLDDNSEIGAHMQSETGHLNSLRHLFKSRTVANLKIYFKNFQLSSTCAQNDLSYHLTLVP